MFTALAWLAGTVLALAWPYAVAMWCVAALGCIGVAMLGSPYLRGLAACGLAFAWTTGHITADLAARWPSGRDGERVLAQLQIDSIPVLRASGGWSFDATLTPERGSADAGQAFHARVAWERPAEQPRAGDTWRAVLALRAPIATLNFDGIDAERQWFRDGVAAIATVVPSRVEQRIARGDATLIGLRERIARAIAARTAGRDAAALLAALAVGATGEMSQEQWRVFNATGTTHLVAISGSHVTVFAALALGLAGFGWRLLPRAGWRIPRDTTASAAALFAATGYSLLAGFSVPTQRTLIMLAAWLVARSAARACGPWRPLGIALIAVLVTDPYAALAAGFWLSFLAIAAILVVTSSRGGDAGAKAAIVAFARVQLAVSAALAPATLAIFGGFAVGGMVVNAVAIPAFTCVLVPLVLAGTASLAVAPPLAAPIFAAAGGLYDAGWPVLAAAADWPLALVRAQPGGGWYALAAAALPIALLPWPGALRLTALAAFAPLIPQPSFWSASGAFEVVALDAGEALAVAVRTRDHLLVYDTGDSFRSGGRGAVETVLPFLQANRLARVDALIVERLTADRVLGVARLMTRLPVERLVTGRDWPGGPASATRCQDAHWRWNDVDFAIIVAPSTDESRSAESSCLLRVASRTGSALLTGDAWPVDLLRVAGTRDLAADLVVVPRHGSRAERMGELAARLHPQLAVISSSFARLVSRHDTVVAWRAAGAQVQATATCGALRLVFAGRPLTPVCVRDGWPWPWRRAGPGPGALEARRPFPGAAAGTMAATLG